MWHEPAPKGSWYLYANLFDICGKAAVSYELTTYRRKDNGDGTFSLKEEKTFAGEFLRTQVDTETASPLYLTRIEFPDPPVEAHDGCASQRTARQHSRASQ